MRVLTPRLHGVLDFVTVAVFALAPVVFGLEGAAATLAYVLAAVHLTMSLFTAGLPISLSGVVPFPLHGLVEAVVGVALGLIGWLVFDSTAQTFYLVMGVVILAVFALTSYTRRET